MNNNKGLKHWTKQFFDVKKIADEKSFVKEAFWKDKLIKELKIERTEEKTGK